MQRPGGRPREPRILNIATHPRPHVSLTVAAEYLGLHEQTVRARIEDGRLRAFRDGRAYRITPKDLDDYQRKLIEDQILDEHAARTLPVPRAT